MALNPAVPFWDEANTITCHAEAAVTGKRFVTVSGPRVDGRPQVSHVAGAVAGKPLGVSAYDVPADTAVSVYSSPGLVMPVRAAVALVAGQPVYSTADGSATNVAPVVGALIAGTVLDDAAIDDDAVVKLA